MRFLIIYSIFLSCFSLSCIGRQERKNQDFRSDITDTSQPDTSQVEVIQEDAITEESSLDFFNPIGVIGTGVVNILSYVEDGNNEVDHFDRITIYNDSLCQDIFSSYAIEHSYRPPKEKNIIPIYNSMNYGWYCFVCTASNNDSYEVAINQTEKKYLKKDRNINYYTWGNFFDSVFTINPTDENPLRELPADDAAVVDIYTNDSEEDLPEDYYQEVRLEGEWLHIKYEKSETEGWLRWRRGNDIIVEISISW